jgi:hypothetical protein
LLMPTLASTPTFGFTFTPRLLPLAPAPLEGVADALEDGAAELLLDGVAELLLDGEALLLDDDWLLAVPCDSDELEFTSSELWPALTRLSTLWRPLPKFTPGLTFAAAFTSLLPMPTFAPMPTLGFTLSVELEVALELVEPGAAEPEFAPESPEVVPEMPEAAPERAGAEPVIEDCELLTPWFRVDDEFTSVESWLAVTPLVTDWVSGALGTQPSGRVFSVFTHFGSSREGVVVRVVVCATTGVARPSTATVARLLMK